MGTVEHREAQVGTGWHRQAQVGTGRHGLQVDTALGSEVVLIKAVDPLTPGFDPEIGL